MKNSYGLNWLADGVAVIMTAIQTNEVYQVISLVCTIVATLFSIALTGVRLIFWYKEAKKDGKITQEEVNEAQKIIDDIKPKDDHK